MAVFDLSIIKRLAHSATYTKDPMQKISFATVQASKATRFHITNISQPDFPLSASPWHLSSSILLIKETE